MDILDQLQAGIQLIDSRTGAEWLIQNAKKSGQVVFLSFKNPEKGAYDY